MPDRYDLLVLHHETLDALNDAGDMVTSNEPFVPGRRRSPRFRASWNEEGICISFRDDIAPRTRAEAGRWKANLPQTSITGAPPLEALAEVFNVSEESIGLGVAYSTAQAVRTTGEAVEITQANASLLAAGFLEEGEIDFIAPSFALVQDAQAVSTAITVRRTPRSIEVGVDTLEAYRGRGYAVATTSTWVNAALIEGLVPFYSTSLDNTASQRVAEKVGLDLFAMDLRIR